MGAGLSRRQVTDRVRRRLQALAAEHGGDYVPATAAQPALARGVTKDGIAWTARFATGNASNGEVFGIPVFALSSGELERSFSGLHGDLGSALAAFRAEADGMLVYLVAGACSPGQSVDAPEASVTRDLGRARWAQQQTGNVADLWIARLEPSGRATLLREFAFTDRDGHKAMNAYMAANGLDIYQAQATLLTAPALEILGVRRSPAPVMRP
jgi:hypothetical protein